MESKIGGHRRGKGNTPNFPPNTVKQCPKRKNHFFTMNNYTEADVFMLLEYFSKHAIRYAFQEEIAPTTGTPHLQGMVMFDKETRSTSFDKLSKGHYEPLKDLSGKYQLKEESRKPEGKQWQYGIPKPIKIISQLYEWQLDIEKIFFTEPDERSIYWFWESTGNIGKSAFVKYMVVKYKCLFCDGGKKSDLINLIFNNDMDTCSCIIWDLPRSTKGNISYATLECVKNGMICNTKYETGTKCFNPPHVFVFANYPPESPEELSSDRWIIKELS